MLNTKRLKFLGDTINANGIETNNCKIQKNFDAPVPLCATQIRAFLGLTNYYRRFIKDYTLSNVQCNERNINGQMNAMNVFIFYKRNYVRLI